MNTQDFDQFKTITEDYEEHLNHAWFKKTKKHH